MTSIREMLNQPYPAEYTTDKNGFVCAEGWKIIELMNEIFGYDGWDDEITEYQAVWAGKKQTKSGQEKDYCAVRCRLKVSVRFVNDMHIMTHEDVGFGFGWGSDPGEAEESAGKEAVTDALKRACRKLGKYLGGSLYDVAGPWMRRIEACTTAELLAKVGEDLGRDTTIPKKALARLKKSYISRANDLRKNTDSGAKTPPTGLTDS